MTQGNIATIDAAKPRLTLITVHKVEAGKRADLARLLSEIADGNIRQAPGFVSVIVGICVTRIPDKLRQLARTGQSA